MKLQELITEGKEVNLIGKIISGKLVTAETRNETWNTDFYCGDEKLTTLVGAPKKVIGNFNCEYNKLTSLEGGPKEVDSMFLCSYNTLTSLKGAPRKVGKDFICVNSKLTSLEGIPSYIGGYFDCSNNRLTSFKDIHKFTTEIHHRFYCEDNPIKSHVLGLLLIPGIKRIVNDDKWANILNKYIGQGRKGMLDCQNELIEDGLEEYAQL